MPIKHSFISKWNKLPNDVYFKELSNKRWCIILESEQQNDILHWNVIKYYCSVGWYKTIIIACLKANRSTCMLNF